jgi:hypothetical protein
MPTKTFFVTRDVLIQTPLPQHGSSYTVIPHSWVIDRAKDELTKNGFTIKHELYKATENGNVAQGMYLLDHTADPDMGMMFAWSNSYDKSRRFKCAIGAHVFICMNGVISGDMASFARKHQGTADQEASDMIDYQISKASEYFNRLIDDKNHLVSKRLSKRLQAEIIGRLFLEEKALTLTQLGIIEREMKKPAVDLGADPNSAWALYNHVTHALKESHPSIYLENHQKVHKIFLDHTKRNHVLNEPTIVLAPEIEFERKALVTQPFLSNSRVVFV